MIREIIILVLQAIEAILGIGLMCFWSFIYGYLKALELYV